MANSYLDFADGTRGQSGPERASIYGRLPEYALRGVLIEGIVVAVRFGNDPVNRSVTGMTEYDVDPLTPGLGRIRCAVKLESVIGLDDGDENILRVAERTIDGGSWSKDGKQPRADGDGDRVLVAFLNGAINRPVILGCMPHPASRVAVKTPRGNARSRGLKHRGFEVKISERGAVTISSKVSTDAYNPSQVNEKSISIGTDATECVPLGNTLLTGLSTLITQMEALCDAVTSLGGTGAAAVKTAIHALSQQGGNLHAGTALSTWVKLTRDPR